MMIGILVSFKKSSFEIPIADTGPEELTIGAGTSPSGNRNPLPGSLSFSKLMGPN